MSTAEGPSNIMTTVRMPHRFPGISALQVKPIHIPLYPGRAARTNAAMNPSIYGSTVEKRSITEAVPFVDALFPNGTIFEGKDGNGRACTMRGFLQYLDTVQSGTPKPNPAYLLSYTKTTKTENQVASFLNELSSQASRYMASGQKKPNQRCRYWSSDGHVKPPPGLDAYRCPDVLCVDGEDSIQDWRLIRTIIELKSGNETDASIHQLCAMRAADLLRVQGSRYFVIICLIHAEEVTVALFDRGGSIISDPFPFTEPQGWATFVRLILGFSFAPPVHLGFDPRTEGIAPLFLSVDSSPGFAPNEIEVYFTAFITPSVHGRGTVVWLGWLGSHEIDKELLQYLGIGEDGCPIIVKNNWVTTDTTLTEGAILSLLSAKGVQGVPRLLAEKGVKADDGDHYISTGYLRAKLGVKMMLGNDALRALRPHAKRGKFSHITGYEDRALVRMYTTPWATPVTQFSSALELLGAFYDYITTHEQAASDYSVAEDGTFHTFFPFRLLHRDLSIDNMGLVPSHASTFPEDKTRPSNMRRGQLIDWGVAAVHSLSHQETEQVISKFPGKGGYQDNTEVEPAEQESDIQPIGLFSASDELEESEVSEDLFTDTDPTPNVFTENLQSSIRFPTLDQCKYAPVPTEGLAHPYKHTPDDVPQLLKYWKTLSRIPRNGEVTGTRPYMALALEAALVATDDNANKVEPASTTRSVSHDCHHDLESIYYCLVAMMLWFYEPHSVRKLSLTTPETQVKYRVPEVLSRLMFPFEPMKPRDKFLNFGTRGGVIALQDELSAYFKPLAPMLRELQDAIFGDNHGQELYQYLDQPPRITHQTFKDILRRWIVKIQTDPLLKSLGESRPAPPNSYPPIDANGRLIGKLEGHVPPLWTNSTFVPTHSLGASSSSTSARLPPPSFWPRVVEVKPTAIIKGRTYCKATTGPAIYAPPQGRSTKKRKERDSDDEQMERMRSLMKVRMDMPL